MALPPHNEHECTHTIKKCKKERKLKMFMYDYKLLDGNNTKTSYLATWI